MQETLKTVPLAPFHAERGARFVPFAGWNMPVQYTSIIQEHLAVRQRVGLFDVSHMGEFLLSGPQAVDFLNYLLTNDYQDLTPGCSRYSMMGTPEGGVVDDLIVYRLDEDRFLICVNASNADKDFAWMQSHAGGFNIVLENQSDQWGLLALQGPDSAAFLAPLIPSCDLSKLQRFQHRQVELAGVTLWLSRTGYTGEDGFELFTPVAGLSAVANAIAERAKALGLPDFYCGLGARDSLRLEAGYPLYGHELSNELDPLTAGMGWTVKLAKPQDFIGKAALSAKKAAGLSERVVFYYLEDRRIARQDEPVWQGTETVGRVLSGTFSPVLGRAIGSALIRSDALKSGSVEVRLRGQSFPLVIAKPPLHKALRI
jgi:aminomethyltransferase